MNRHEARILLMQTIYRHRLLQDDLRMDFANYNPERPYDDFILQIVEDLAEHENNYIGLIQTNLNKWSFERLNYVDQAILLLAASEMHLGLNEKAVVIDEALRLSKKFSDPDNYRYINGVLDNL